MYLLLNRNPSLLYFDRQDSQYCRLAGNIHAVVFDVEGGGCTCLCLVNNFSAKLLKCGVYTVKHSLSSECYLDFTGGNFMMIFMLAAFQLVHLCVYKS